MKKISFLVMFFIVIMLCNNNLYAGKNAMNEISNKVETSIMNNEDFQVMQEMMDMVSNADFSIN